MSQGSIPTLRTLALNLAPLPGAGQPLGSEKDQGVGLECVLSQSRLKLRFKFRALGQVSGSMLHTGIGHEPEPQT